VADELSVPAANSRTYDVVLLGATGFTGRLTAEYLAEHAPVDCRWALAGRSTSRLEAVRADLAAVDPALADLPLVTSDVTDADSLRALAEQTRVVITTVGPYLHHGEPLVAACAEAGTDYVDLTGEPEFVDRMYLGYQDTAAASGARLVHCCGFDSVPHDLGVLFTMKHLPSGVPATVRGVVRAGGTSPAAPSTRRSSSCRVAGACGRPPRSGSVVSRARTAVGYARCRDVRTRTPRSATGWFRCRRSTRRS
jgi:saccharopine dehydrogenase (NAD+, L-glutamate forming)